MPPSTLSLRSPRPLPGAALRRTLWRSLRRRRTPPLPPRLQLRRPLDDLAQHLPGLAAARRPVRLPDRRLILRQDLREITKALHAVRGNLRDVDVARPLVAV